MIFTKNTDGMRIHQNRIYGLCPQTPVQWDQNHDDLSIIYTVIDKAFKLLPGRNSPCKKLSVQNPYNFSRPDIEPYKVKEPYRTFWITNVQIEQTSIFCPDLSKQVPHQHTAVLHGKGLHLILPESEVASADRTYRLFNVDL